LPEGDPLTKTQKNLSNSESVDVHIKKQRKHRKHPKNNENTQKTINQRIL